MLALALATSLFAVPAAAQDVPPQLDAPWTDVAPRVEGDRVVATAVGMPDERFGRMQARRSAARRSGEVRAREMIHRWADGALARVAAGAATASAVHRVIDERCEVARVRALVDGGAVIELALALEALRAVAPQRGLPWSA